MTSTSSTFTFMVRLAGGVVEVPRWSWLRCYPSFPNDVVYFHDVPGPSEALPRNVGSCERRVPEGRTVFSSAVVHR